MVRRDDKENYWRGLELSPALFQKRWDSPSGYITGCIRFATLTQIVPLRFATSHTPKTLGEIRSWRKRDLRRPKNGRPKR